MFTPMRSWSAIRRTPYRGATRPEQSLENRVHSRRTAAAAVALALALCAGACSSDSGDEEPLLSGEQPEVDEATE